MSTTCVSLPVDQTEEAQGVKKAEGCILVIFGATGDLTARKLIPALYNLARENQLPSNFACVGFARREKTDESFRQEMFEAVKKFSRVQPIDQVLWDKFSQNLFYHRSEFHDDAGYESLRERLNEIDKKKDTKGNRVFYFSTPPSYFPEIARELSEHKLIEKSSSKKNGWSRVIVEKPFGENLESAKLLQSQLENHLDESQIYRIDHYLGKETVQNLLVFRFTNALFEDLWNNRHVDHIQMTVAENIGVGTRGALYEESGLLRDIMQNHMMQLLSLTAMEPPRNLHADAIHDEKVKVLESIRPISKCDVDKYVVRGQYGPGSINGKPQIGYQQENNVSPTSNVETYLALQLYIDNWRWSGVPFFLRSGKCLPNRCSEILITFKNAPKILFQSYSKTYEPNVLAIRIQPNEGISLKINCKVPGLLEKIQPVKMDFRYESYFGVAPPEAYERLILDFMAGDRTLFARIDEVLASWKLMNPIFERWKEIQPKFPNYPAGTAGPKEADDLLERQGKKWGPLSA